MEDSAKPERQPVTPAGYRKLSVLIHWASTLLLVIMFVTSAAEDNSPLLWFHQSVGPLIGLLLLYRVFYRIRHGLAPAAKGSDDQLNRVIIWLLLAVTTTLVVSGLLLPWLQGTALNVLGVALTAPFGLNPAYLNLIESCHRYSAYLLVPLLFLHIIFSSTPDRMFSSDQNGH
jgi:cytochrome b561